MLLPVAFWLFLVVAILNGIAGSSLVLLLVASVVGIAAGTLYQGMVVNLVRDIQDGRRDFSAGELLSQATPFILPLIGAGILAGLAIGIGLFLFIVPGLVLLTIWAVIAPVIVVEKSPVMASFGRSRELVRGNGWPVFGAIFVAFLIVIIGGIVFAAIAAASPTARCCGSSSAPSPRRSRRRSAPWSPPSSTSACGRSRAAPSPPRPSRGTGAADGPAGAARRLTLAVLEQAGDGQRQALAARGSARTRCGGDGRRPGAARRSPPPPAAPAAPRASSATPPAATGGTR